MNKNKNVLIITLMCILIIASMIIQIRTIESTNSPVLKVIANDSLRNDILMLKSKYDNISKELEKAEKKLNKVRSEASKNDENFTKKEEQIKKYNTVLGLTEVTGEGIIIKITVQKLDETIKESLGNIVNELKNAGAEAISLNEQRMVELSVIFFNENSIEVNSEKIDSPFTIKAIGDTRLLYGAILRPGGYIELLNYNRY